MDISGTASLPRCTAVWAVVSVGCGSLVGWLLPTIAGRTRSGPAGPGAGVGLRAGRGRRHRLAVAGREPRLPRGADRADPRRPRASRTGAPRRPRGLRRRAGRRTRGPRGRDAGPAARDDRARWPWPGCRSPIAPCRRSRAAHTCRTARSMRPRRRRDRDRGGSWWSHPATASGRSRAVTSARAPPTPRSASAGTRSTPSTERRSAPIPTWCSPAVRLHIPDPMIRRTP